MILSAIAGSGRAARASASAALFAFVERVDAVAVESAMPPKGSTRLARALRADVATITRGQPMRWVMVHELGLRHPDAGEAAIEAAIALAIDKGWMIGEARRRIASA